MIDWDQMKTPEQIEAEKRAALVPEKISRAQGKMALLQAGLWPDVLNFVESLEPEQKISAEIALNDTIEWRRESPFLIACAGGLGISPEQLDGLFIQASQILL